MTRITFDGVVIEFTEAKIELYEIIEVMSSLSQECLAKKGVHVRDIATLIKLMAKTISSASQGRFSGRG